MYIPKAFQEEDPLKLQQLMKDYNFATLVSVEDGLPVASHIPFIFDFARGPHGTLLGHVARANPQWQSFKDGREVLVIFQGPHAYVTPSWYDAPLSVPTWNYAAVHAYGVPRIIEDAAGMLALLEAQVRTYESSFEQPWPYDLPGDFVEKLMRGTVGFEIPISRLEGKYKLNQNRSRADQERVASHLETSPDSAQRVIADLMKARQK